MFVLSGVSDENLEKMISSILRHNDITLLTDRKCIKVFTLAVFAESKAATLTLFFSYLSLHQGQ